jgi:hypothetical protein
MIDGVVDDQAAGFSFLAGLTKEYETAGWSLNIRHWM